jgi:CheY-like chemotaxis protein
MAINQSIMTENKKHILVVDDDRIYQFTAIKILESTQLTASVQSCLNGAEAIDYIKKKVAAKEVLPHIIFLDINMPIMSGWDFLQEFEALNLQPNCLKIYIVSSSVDDYDINKSKSFNWVTGYLIKPISKERFIEVLSSK